MSTTARPSGDTTSGGLFLRKSSGLVREFGGRDVFVFNTIGYALGLVLAIVPLLMAGAGPGGHLPPPGGPGPRVAVVHPLPHRHFGPPEPRPRRGDGHFRPR